MFALTFALIEANEYGLDVTHDPLLFAVAGIGVVAFVLLELHQRAPMLDLSLFRNGTFTGANIVALLVFLAMFGDVLLRLALRPGHPRPPSPVQAGAMFLPMTMLLIMFVAPVAGKLSDRVSSRAGSSSPECFCSQPISSGCPR